jgi:hypothetical protein
MQNGPRALEGIVWWVVKSGEFHDETHWTITLQQPTAVQVEAASGAVVKGMHLCPAKVTVPAQGLWYTLETSI